MFELTSNGLVEVETPHYHRVVFVTGTGQLGYFDIPAASSLPTSFVYAMHYVARRGDSAWVNLKDKLNESYMDVMNADKLPELIEAIGNYAGIFKPEVSRAPYFAATAPTTVPSAPLI